MSDTPRTDAEANGGNSMGVLMGNGLRYALVQSEFARQLERELNEARTRIKELADIGGELADYLDLDDCECSDCQHLSRPVKDWQETVKRCLKGIE